MVIKHTCKRARQTVRVDRLLPCNSPPPAVHEVDSGILPDTQTPTDGHDIPDGDSQPLLGLEEDSQSRGDSESQTHPASGTSLPVRVRRRPTALEPYILD